MKLGHAIRRATAAVVAVSAMSLGLVATAAGTAHAVASCTGDVSMYGTLSDGRLTYTQIEPNTGNRVKTLIGPNLGFTPKAMAALNFNTVLVTSTTGDLYRVDVQTNNTSLALAGVVQIWDGGWTFDKLVYDGTIYLDSVRTHRPTVEHATSLARLGGRIRTTPSLPTRMIIMDRLTAVIPVSSDDTAAGAVLLTGQGTLTALCALFETTWESAQPLGEIVSTDPNGLNGQQATALRLLAEGHTDEAIAKRLGVSHCTARRIASELMERLDARSRFEAGVRAVQRGRLPDRC
ncbi:helix-turn-helix transcriptional regulator [Actinacidiphila glaucinigra]